jgi:aminomethyltransferase
MRRTPLYDEHARFGAKMIEFGGWEMPVQYTSIIDEHLAVRRAAGMFDVSHMGDIIIRGPGAKEALRRLLTNDVEGLPMGKALYAHILDDHGRILDDAIVYHWREHEYLMVPNAATTAKVLAWVLAHRTTEEVIDVSERLACIAIQGPKAQEVLDELTFCDLSKIKRLSGEFVELCAEGRNAAGVEDFQESGFLCDLEPRKCHSGAKGCVADFSEMCYVSRTGYTGEDGFEVLVERASAPALWKVLLNAGRGLGLQPAGLGARDTLRLEMGFLLSGTDFDGSQTSLQTGPPWVVKLEHDFIGKKALLRQQNEGGYPLLVCLELEGKGVPRHGYDIVAEGHFIGKVTSGTLSPCLKKGIAMGYVPPQYTKVGTQLAVRIRDVEAEAKVVHPPFLRR